MSLQTLLKDSVKSRLESFKAARIYKAQRAYFKSKTQSYLDYLSQAGLLRDLPQDHAKKVLEFWTPLLSLSLSWWRAQKCITRANR
ncbi:hypothetical protein [Helicobacter canis]|uniref:Uncharacterized protein n=1 Tax=Helicobacter canis NCTC 12740 TaxID=1357399 RepID=V8CL68_9HELI|nr:hypothetical protein [Helicobacter canis]ETD27471.1 hypothetical protein HMPREF2087_00389 [Helicobacter canis NCTC 12740]